MVERTPVPVVPERAPPRDVDTPARRHAELMRQAARDVRKPEGR